MRMLSAFFSRIMSFRNDDKGSTTVEFVMLLPLYMLIFTIAFETGTLSIRQVYLEHALSVTVREVRIGTILEPTHASMIENICDNASIIPDCLNQVRLEMYQTSPSSWDPTAINDEPTCRDRTEDDAEALTEFTNTGTNNDLMFLRVCAVFDPLLPTIGFGKYITESGSETYALVASSGYVMEPYE